MELNQLLPLSITFVITMVGSFITIKVTMAEFKKDLSFLKDKLETELTAKIQHESQAKEDMKEVKDDLKMIFKSINEIQINFARMEARSEGKDDVINELKNAVTAILKDKR
jgi:hypothetical protein